jgi:hypothetical protein
VTIASKTALRRIRRVKQALNTRLLKQTEIDEAPPMDELPPERLLRSDSPPEIIGLSIERALAELYAPGVHPLQKWLDRLAELPHNLPEATRVQADVQHKPPESIAGETGRDPLAIDRRLQ